MSNRLEQLNDALSDVAAAVRASLVQVHNGQRGHGAGTIWHPNGLILTNAHVAANRNLRVTLADGRTFPAHLLARDPGLDLAALAIDASDLPAIELGRSQQLRPGEWVLALGHPWGQIGAATGGVVIDPCADLPEMETGREWLTVSLHLRPGHSGGPLIDAQGRLVGINTMMNGPDVGVAVPVHVVKRFLRESLERETARV